MKAGNKAVSSLSPDYIECSKWSAIKKTLPPSQERKPPPFFVSGIKLVKVFNDLIAELDIVPNEMKALASGDRKIVPNTSDDYRKLCRTLSDIASLSDSYKKQLGATAGR